MNISQDLTAIIQYHRDMIRWHGKESTYALGWLDKESQLIRFRALSAIADLGGATVLDAGCGYGEFLPYLTELYEQVSYTGIEQMPELLGVAIDRYRDWPQTVFISGNFATMNIPPADYVFASGSLNYRSDDPEFIYKIILRLYQSSTRGFAFNLLREIIPNGALVAYNPALILNFCQTVCENVRLIDDYADEDFTIYMYH